MIPMASFRVVRMLSKIIVYPYSLLIDEISLAAKPGEIIE